MKNTFIRLGFMVVLAIIFKLAFGDEFPKANRIGILFIAILTAFTMATAIWRARKLSKMPQVERENQIEKSHKDLEKIALRKLWLIPVMLILIILIIVLGILSR